MPDRWCEAKAILAVALDEPTHEKRLEAARQRCGRDAELFREVSSLLEQTTSTIDSFVERAARPLRREALTTASGHAIGAYAIVRELGRGGMGAVFLAKRADGAFDKDVAIKVLKRGTDTDEVLRRFQSERQILARLVHPNIARLLDAGTTEDGLPYFVMDYVEGKPLTAYAHDCQLPIRRRLELFRVVCAAISYAHQNLVVHRDLKPSNVLVTEDGDVKLLDFGIAKLLDESPPDVTLTIERRLTPVYASPEQVKGEPVTTASDVYSLGVLLYELLTGERPYVVKTGGAQALAHAICEQQPQRPSTALRANQRSDARIARSIRGDLDNIVLKALRKEPSRRYPSADQVSEDIRRHLEGLPVRARKDTFGYRAAKFVRRHKAGVAAAAAVALLLFASTIIAVWQAREARDGKQLAQERFEQVRKLAHSILFDYHDQIATLPGSTKVREQLVTDSLAYLDALARQSGDNPALQRELAAAYIKVGDVQGRPYFANLGDAAGARQSYHKALAIWQRLNHGQNDLTVEQNLGATFERLGEIEQTVGNPTAALADLHQGITVYEHLVGATSSCPDCEAELARMYGALALVYGASATASVGDSAQSLRYHEKALEIYERLLAQQPRNLLYRQRVPIEQCYIAQLYSDGGDQQRALRYYTQALDAHRQLASEEPANTYLQRELAVNYSNVCGIRMLTADPGQALQDCAQARAIFQSLATADPNDANIRRDLAIIERKTAEALDKSADRAGAAETFAVALRLFDELAKQHPEDDYLLHHQAVAYLRRSEFRRRSNDAANAASDASKAIQIAQSVGTRDSSNVLATKDLATAYEDLATAARQLGRADEATSYLKKASGLWEALAARHAVTAIERNRIEALQHQLVMTDENKHG